MTHTINFRRGLCLLLSCFALMFVFISPITAYASDQSELQHFYDFVAENYPASSLEYFPVYKKAAVVWVAFDGAKDAEILVLYDNVAPRFSTNSNGYLISVSSEPYFAVYMQDALKGSDVPLGFIEVAHWDYAETTQYYSFTVTYISDPVVYSKNPWYDEELAEPTRPPDDPSGGSSVDMGETNMWLSNIFSKISGLAESITQPITDALSTLAGKITIPIQNALNTVKGAVDNVKTTLGNIGNLIQQQVVGGITAVKNAVNSVGDGVTQVVDFFTGTSYVESPTAALKFGSLFDLFPFNIPKGIYDAISFWEASASPPVITIPLPSYTGGAMDIYEFEINFSEIPGMDALAALIRAGELILFVVGLVILTEKVTKW